MRLQGFGKRLGVLSHRWRGSGQHLSAKFETTIGIKAKGLDSGNCLSLSNQSTYENQLESTMNLTQTKQAAKTAYLEGQQAEMLAIYQNASDSERSAIIKQIDSFLESVPADAKKFWLIFRRKLETLNEQTTQNKALFPLGEIYLTIGAKEALEESNQLPNVFLQRHQTGDWGDVCKADRKENDLSLKEGFRILSSYKTSKDVKIWVITEADRKSSCLLLPEEY